MTNCIVWSV